MKKITIVVSVIIIFIIIYLMFFFNDGTRVAGLNIEDFFTDPKVKELAVAAASGNEKKVEALSKEGVDVNAVGNDGMTPLLWALGAKNENGMKALLEAGADPNSKTKKKGQKGDYDVSPMALTAGSKYQNLLRILLEYGGNSNLKNHLDQPILFEALDRSQWDNFYLLLDKGADINARARDGETAILRAAMMNYWDQVVKMIERGADVTISDVTGATLAWWVQTNKVGPDQIKFRDQVKKMLEDRGVKFPVPQPV